MDYVSLHAHTRPGATVVKDLTFNRQWTYAEFDDLVSRCVALLRRDGVSQGDRVACVSRNRAEIVVLHLACARMNAIFVPLNWRLIGAEIGALLGDCMPRLLFCDEAGKALCDENVEAAECLDINALFNCCAAIEPLVATSFARDLPSLMLYTSGTTGRPKGVLLSERNISETAINFTTLGDVDARSVFLCETPMFHIIGIVTSVRPALLCGGQLVISDGFLPERTLSCITDPKLGITHYFCVPQMALALRNEPQYMPESMRSLRAVFTGGAPHPAAQIRDWLNDGIAIVDGYGSSEAGTVFGMPLDRTLIDRKAGSVGVPTPRVEARIVDDSGEDQTAGSAGELLIRGDNLTSRYWQSDGQYIEALDQDGWFATGDVAVVDKDGFYFIVDRKKDMYISGGENVYPAEVEALLVKYPGIRDVAVVGVPDDKWGETGCVFYVGDSLELREEDIADFLSGKLARYKFPRRVLKIDSIPRNGAGKVLKKDLREVLSKPY